MMISRPAHIGFFHVLAIVDSAAMNLGAREYFQIIVLPRYMPAVGLLDYVATPLLVFSVASILFSIVAVPIYIPGVIGSFLKESSINTLERICSISHSYLLSQTKCDIAKPFVLHSYSIYSLN